MYLLNLLHHFEKLVSIFRYHRSYIFNRLQKKAGGFQFDCCFFCMFFYEKNRNRFTGAHLGYLWIDFDFFNEQGGTQFLSYLYFIEISFYFLLIIVFIDYLQQFSARFILTYSFLKLPFQRTGKVFSKRLVSLHSVSVTGVFTQSYSPIDGSIFVIVAPSVDLFCGILIQLSVKLTITIYTVFNIIRECQSRNKSAGYLRVKSTKKYLYDNWNNFNF